jgi:tetratricopeptide (TPR) repeat protein
MVTRYALHPATAQFITDAQPADRTLILATHHRLGKHLEAEAKTSPYLEMTIEAGRHLFEAGDFDRAYELLGNASQWLQERGRVREGLKLLVPFLAETVLPKMAPILRGRLLGTVAAGYYHLSEVEKAIGYYEQTLPVFREISDRRGEGSDLGNLGHAYNRLGEVEKAKGYYQQALAIGRAIKDPRIVQACEGNLARLSESG